MPVITRPLTNTEITHAKPRAVEYNLADGGGLLLRVKPNGSKAWLFNYNRVVSKKRTNLGLGIFPEVSLAQARQIRAEYRALLAQGIDPKDHREQQEVMRRQTAENTLYSVAEKWRAKRAKEIKERTNKNKWQCLELHLFPKLGQRPISEITPRMLVEALRPLEKQGKLSTLKSVVQAAKNIMRFAVNSGVLEFSKCETVSVSSAFSKHETVHYATISPEETPEFISVLEAYQQQNRSKRLNVLAVKWQMLTMTRPTEAIWAQWEEIDLEAKTWTIPAERMKKGRVHIVPLSEQALSVLAELHALKNWGVPIAKQSSVADGYVFPILWRNRKSGRSGKPRKSRVLTTLHALGYKNRLTAHGLRSIARTYLADKGINWEVAEACIAHAVGNTTSRAYDRSNYLEQRRPVMQLWADFLTDCGMTSTVGLIEPNH